MLIHFKNLNWGFLKAYAFTQIKLRYRHTSLGIMWNVLEPVLYLGTLSLVFSAINRMELSDYVVYLFSTLVPWRYFEATILGVMESIIAGEWLLKKLAISYFIFPLTRWLIAAIDFFYAFAVVLVILVLVKPSWTIHVFILPLSIFITSAAALGIGMLLAVAYTFFRDIKPLATTGLMLTFFSAPILFKADAMPMGSLQSELLVYHPVTYFAALFQKPLYYNCLPSLLDWLVTAGIASVFLGLGIWAIHYFTPRFYFYL
ncbi:MAG: ABC transporter permease [Methylococcales bacterium]|nr:ABC transporter permease [Methylococcales bacterium]